MLFARKWFFLHVFDVQVLEHKTEAYVKLSYRPFLLNRGSGFFSSFTRRKKALKARSTRI